jgi:hypothetical protein
MYQPYPSGGQEPMQQQPPAPSSVLTAVKLMYAGAALSAIGIVLELVSIGSVKSAIKKANPKLTTTQIHSAEIVGVAIVVIIGLIGVGLWIWMAWANGRGKNWARIVASVLFGLSTIDVLLSVARPHATIGLLLTILVWLVGLGAILFLWRKDSSAYFQVNQVR